MSFYSNSPGTTPRSILIEQGWPVYLFGSRVATDAQMAVTSVAIASNVATVGVTGWSGPLPVVGAFASLQGTQTNSGIFNVTNAAITGVSVDQTGTGTITFALTHANVSTTTDVGWVYIRFAAVGDALTSAGGASIAGSVGNVVGRNGNWLTAALNVQGVSAVTGKLPLVSRTPKPSASKVCPGCTSTTARPGRPICFCSWTR